MKTSRKAAIVYHAGAGRGHAPRLVAPVRRALKSAGWRVVDLEPTRWADHARTELAPYLADRVDLIVAIVGDGTLRELCAGLGDASARIPVGLVPVGNANVVARDQGIPLDPRAAIALLTRGSVRRLDVGRLCWGPGQSDASTFLAMVEIGFGARVVQIVHRLRRGRLNALYRRWGDILYGAAALGALLASHEKPFRIGRGETAASTELRAAVIANTRCYAKGWAMAPGARMDDGLLDVVGRRKSGAGVFLRSAYAAARQRRAPTAFSCYGRGQRFVLYGQEPLTVQADGDPMPAGQWMEIDLLPERLSLITPP
jgi:diacylglycerol kinase family enzyme